MSFAEGERVMVPNAGEGRIRYVRGDCARVTLDAGRERTVPLARLVSREPRAPMVGSSMEPITSSAEISGVIGGPSDFTLAAPRERRVAQREPWLRSSKYLAWVRKHPCCHCGRLDSIEAHHWSHRGGVMGAKVDDYRTVPLCTKCHNQEWHQHGTLPGLDRVGSEAVFVATQLKLVAEWLTFAYTKRPESVLDALVGALRELDT